MKSIYTIPAGEFKSKCLNLMDQVNEQHINITITKHGKPIARLVPIDEKPVDFFGCMQDTATIRGDIIAPVEVDWEANK